MGVVEFGRYRRQRRVRRCVSIPPRQRVSVPRRPQLTYPFNTCRLGIVTETGSEAGAVWDRMFGMAPLCYRRHRFPPEIIQHAIWLYLRVTLSYRDVEEV